MSALLPVESPDVRLARLARETVRELQEGRREVARERLEAVWQALQQEGGGEGWIQV